MAPWVIRCAAAEGLGMLAAAGAAQVVEARAWHPAVVVAVMVLGGLIEGFCIAIAIGTCLRLRLPELALRRFVVVTTAVAGLGWAAGSLPSALAGRGSDAATPSMWWTTAGAAAVGAVMGTALGAAQALVIRRITEHSGRWVAGSALAWTPAMTVIFLGASVPGPTWPAAAVLLSAGVTGLAAGALLGLVLASAARRLHRPGPH